MRIAVSGAHRTGKTTLVRDLLRSLPTYLAIDEPYHLLVDDGHEFAARPSLEDFELQLERSIEEMGRGGEDLLVSGRSSERLRHVLARLGQAAT